jgi:hypothetical protein
MRYTVTYLPAAEAELMRIWLRASDQQAVTSAANTIDRLLGRFPEQQGEEVDEGRRLIVEPLAVTFQVIPDDCLVRVLQVELVEGP